MVAAMEGNAVTVERVIPAPAEKIFELLADPGRHSEIDGSGTVTGTSSPRVTKVGDTFEMKMRMGAPYRMINEIVEYEEGRRIAWKPRLSVPGLNRIVGGRVWRYELEPVEGGTRVRETWDISGDPLKALIKRSPMATSTGPSMQKTLERIESAVR